MFGFSISYDQPARPGNTIYVECTRAPIFLTGMALDKLDGWTRHRWCNSAPLHSWQQFQHRHTERFEISVADGVLSDFQKWLGWPRWGNYGDEDMLETYVKQLWAS